MNFVCVLKVQKRKFKVKYDSSWVEKLYNQVKRNYDKEFKFYCFTNVETVGINIPLTEDLDRWWNKLEIFKKGILNGPTLYLDLDVIIYNNITSLVDSFSDYNFLMCREPGQYSHIINSSLMYFNGDYSRLFHDYIQNKENYNIEYARIPRYGDQAFISERINPKFIEDIDPTAISWKHHEVNTEINPNGKFLIFTSRHQKPDNNLDLQIVKENWK